MCSFPACYLFLLVSLGTHSALRGTSSGGEGSEGPTPTHHRLGPHRWGVWDLLWISQYTASDSMIWIDFWIRLGPIQCFFHSTFNSHFWTPLGTSYCSRHWKKGVPKAETLLLCPHRAHSSFLKYEWITFHVLGPEPGARKIRARPSHVDTWSWRNFNMNF